MEWNRKIVAAALGVSCITAAGAAKADGVTWYVGADLVQFKTNVDDKTGVPPLITGSATATTLRLKGGANLTSWLALEGQLIFPQEKTFSSTAGIDNSVQSTVAAFFVKPNTDLGPVNVYGLLGVASAGHEFNGVIEGKKTVSDLAFGIGAQYRFNKNLAVSVDWTQYTNKNLAVDGLSGGLDVKTSAFGVGVNYTF